MKNSTGTSGREMPLVWHARGNGVERGQLFYLEGSFHLVFWEDSVWSWLNPTDHFKYWLLFHFAATCNKRVQITFASRFLVTCPSSCPAVVNSVSSSKTLNAHQLHPVQVKLILFQTDPYTASSVLHYFDLNDAILDKLICSRVNFNSLCKPSLLKNAFPGTQNNLNQQAWALLPAWGEF